MAAIRSQTRRPKRLTELERECLALMGDELEERPQTRGECEGGHRPCPFVGCRHNLFLDVNPRNGHIKFNFPGVEPEGMDPERSCALDLAERGGMTLEEVSETLAVTRERIRQLEEIGKERLKRRLQHTQDEEEEMAVEKKCEKCGEDYLARRHDQKYCSDNCRKLAREPNRETVVKEVVGAPPQVATPAENGKTVSWHEYVEMQSGVAKAEEQIRDLKEVNERAVQRINDLARENEGLKAAAATVAPVAGGDPEDTEFIVLLMQMLGVAMTGPWRANREAILEAVGNFMAENKELLRTSGEDAKFRHRLLILLGKFGTDTPEGDREAILEAVRELQRHQRATSHLSDTIANRNEKIRELGGALKLDIHGDVVRRGAGEIVSPDKTTAPFNPCDLTLGQFQQAIYMLQGIAEQAGRLAVLDEEGE